MKHFALLAIALLAFLAQPTLARTRPGETGRQIHDGTSGSVRFPAPGNKARVDSLYLLGGPGSWDGSFETPGGDPDWHGWTHVDVTLNESNHWHVSTYWAEYIEGYTHGNHALYCGNEYIPACAPPDTIGGVGRGWLDDVEWRYTVSDPSQPVTVRLTGLMLYDLPDAGWDFLELYIQRGDVPDLLGDWTGSTDTTVNLDFTEVLLPGEFTGPGNDEVVLFWRVWTSIDGWDDEDCINPSHGACQLDDLSVYFDDELITFDDFETGNPVNWTPAELRGVGDFSNLRNDLGEIDPCRGNDTWQVNFVDDGVVVPGTGGTPCYFWCYDPGGWMVNNTGGLLEGTGDWFLENQIISPAMAWPADMDGAELAFDVYRHENLLHDSAGVLYYWHVRSTDSPDPAELEFAPWRDRVMTYHGGPEFLRHEESVGDLLVPDRQWVQVALVVNELGWSMGWNGPNGTPAPYFDNVSVKAWDPQGPEIHVSGKNLFSDAFPEAGVVNPADPAANWCRVDTQAPVDVGLYYVPGDSLQAFIDPTRHGATVPEPPSMHWVLSCNPAFDAVRPENPDGQGLLRGMVTGSVVLDYGGNPRVNTWSFDLPDTGWFFPGDKLHYYLTASDDLDGNIRTAAWPPDTTAVLDFSFGSPFPMETTVSALPTLTPSAATDLVQPDLLICDATQDPADAAVWFDALQELGYGPGTEFDIMTVYKGNGTGGIGLATGPGNLAGYQTLIYTSGKQLARTISGSYISNDAQLILDWLATGEKHALMAGDNLSYGMRNSLSGEVLRDQLGVQYYDIDIGEFNGDAHDLQASPVMGNGVLPDDIAWFVYAGCPDIKHFDAIGQIYSGQTSATLHPEGAPGGTYAALVTVADEALVNRTATMPFDLVNVTGWTGAPGENRDPVSAPAYYLDYLLDWLVADGVSAVDDVPGIGQISVNAHPNPFNPSTTIAFDLPRAMEVSLDIFDLQGRLVRSLLDESPYVAGGHKQVWDGRNNEGGATASGVYFFRFKAGDQDRVGKLTLLK